ncbi:MAG: hypothetical protein JNK67_21610 [Alphaproteobacteria bacterium]|nr:hypothetical protein [Alphaproteobacteria bacterium]
MRIVWFFGYMAAIIVIPAIILAVVQFFVGPLQWPPPHGYTGRLPTAGEITAIGIFTGAWVIAQFFIFGRVASWAGAVPATAGASPVGAAELTARLIALNALRAPWTVSQGRRPNELVIDWRYGDATWLDHMRVHGLRRSYRLVLRLDEGPRRVRAMEHSAALDWSAGGRPVAASLRWTASRGIKFFEFAHERVFGVQIRNGMPTLDLSYAYTFNLQELKGPIIALVTAAGWEWRPVVTFFRPVGG